MYSCIYFFIIFCMHLNIQTLWGPQPTLQKYDFLLQILFQKMKIGHL
jgi:hypothetical protein